MKRRSFFRKFGGGVTGASLFPGILNSNNSRNQLHYTYPLPQNIDELRNEEGEIVLRLRISGKSEDLYSRSEGKIKVKRGKFERLKRFFNSGDNRYDAEKGTFSVLSSFKDEHLFTCRISDADEKTVLRIKLDSGNLDYQIADLLHGRELTREGEQLKISVNALLFNEIGVIDPKEVGIDITDDDFRFIIMADPQGGDPEEETNESPTRMKIHNAFIEESIEVANELEPASSFCIILGDFTDSKGQARNFRRMMDFYDKLKQPMLLEIGNHETRYGARFTPGYNMSELDNYFAAQKEINGLEKLLYSFDLGDWHFIIWPDPLRSDFWDAHPHYFEWLEKDLEKNKNRSTFFFQHVPIHPIGINPLVSYVNPVEVNRLLFSILSGHGNVKYVFSGHVHIPIRSSEKTAVQYKGIKMINLPPTGYRPRAFGEQDLYGGPTQGICIVDVKNGNADIHFKTITREVYKYSGKYREYSEEKDPLWFNRKWELPAHPEILNGGFEDGLDHWYSGYVYVEDQDPSNIRETRPAPDKNGDALYMYSRKRGYDTPGQDRLPQTLNQISQIIEGSRERIPAFRLSYRIDGEKYHPESWNGAFLWIEGYTNTHLVLSHLYAIGKAHPSVGGSYGRSVRTSFMDLTGEPDVWHKVLINLQSDFRKNNNEKSILDLSPDRYVLNLGTWTINDGYKQEIGVFFDDLAVAFYFPDDSGETRLDDKPVNVMDPSRIFSGRIHHEAGEHQYIDQKEIYPY